MQKDQFNSLSDLQVGKSYRVQDLIAKMIENSDNGAEFLLLSNIDQNSLESIYSILNIEKPSQAGNNFIISPREYSLFFRIIYSATYLNEKMSEKALELLSKTTFSDGLAAGVPQGTTVAHKFGEYVISQNGQLSSVELHDCGIIYYSNTPYFLCVMTKGNNLDTLKSTIKTISGMVWKSYASQK